MKKTLTLILVVFLSTVFSGSALSRETKQNVKKIFKVPGKTDLMIDDSAPGFFRAAAVDTYNIVRYDFEIQDWQGWARIDNTAQVDTFFHVDDFSGLGGGDYGRLAAIEGSQSMWCGARPVNDFYVCGWETPPGYGNKWDQQLVSEQIIFEGTLHLNFHLVYDCEGYGYDNFYIEYENNDNWVNLATYGGVGDVIDSYSVDSATVGGSTRLRFHFISDGGFSDEDGYWNTDGAAIIDSITVYDTGSYYNYEDFEAASVGDHSAGIWQPMDANAFGKYSGLLSGMRVLNGDPCHENLTTQIIFFFGSTVPADQDKYPGLYVTPFCLNGGGLDTPCQNESVISALIDMTKYSSNNDNIQDMTIPVGARDNFAGILFQFEVFGDLPMDNLVFYRWAVRNIINDCPEDWRDRPNYYGPLNDGYQISRDNISDLVTSPNDTLQIEFTVIDMCDSWGGIYGSCENHSPGPWFDNVSIQRYDISGPQWSYDGINIFQDNFPPIEDADGFVRADMALDITGTSVTDRIDPGDSIAVSVASPLSGGLSEYSGGGAEVFIHVKAHDIGNGGNPDLYGPQMISDPWMTYISDNGEWTVLQGDTARTPYDIFPDRYMFDLNDSLLTKGYMVEYYFSAKDLDGKTSYLPENALDGGAFEFTCLPTGNTNVLYVDDYDGRGSWNGLVQDYLDPALNAVLSAGYPDRYDINSPSSTAGNGPESRTDVKNLGLFYHTIIWDSGNLGFGTIGNGTFDESNDCALLEAWAKDEGTTPHNHKTNLLVMGDDVVSDLDNKGATSFLTDILGVGLFSYTNSYYALTGGNAGGGIINPLITPVSGSIFNGLDDFYALGGCPVINMFDVLQTVNTDAAYGLKYPDFNSSSYYAAVYMDDTTATFKAKRAVTTGFSFMTIRDNDGSGALVRNEFLAKVWEFFENGVKDTITDSDDPKIKHINELCQNYPNPFNPATTIKFNLKKKGHVSILIYDVAGRLVNTLVDEVLGAGPNEKNWRGINDRGEGVASGVYFYRMKTGNFAETKKMIMLR